MELKLYTTRWFIVIRNVCFYDAMVEWFIWGGFTFHFLIYLSFFLVHFILVLDLWCAKWTQLRSYVELILNTILCHSLERNYSEAYLKAQRSSRDLNYLWQHEALTALTVITLITPGWDTWLAWWLLIINFVLDYVYGLLEWHLGACETNKPNGS